MTHYPCIWKQFNLCYQQHKFLTVFTLRFHTILFKLCNHLQSFCFCFVFLNVAVSVWKDSFISPWILILNISATFNFQGCSLKKNKIKWEDSATHPKICVQLLPSGVPRAAHPSHWKFKPPLLKDRQLRLGPSGQLLTQALAPENVCRGCAGLLSGWW